METRVSLRYFASYCSSFLMVHTILRVTKHEPIELVHTLTVTHTNRIQKAFLAANITQLHYPLNPTKLQKLEDWIAYWLNYKKS